MKIYERCENYYNLIKIHEIIIFFKAFKIINKKIKIIQNSSSEAFLLKNKNYRKNCKVYFLKKPSNEKFIF